jgi:hypothetical protein
VSRVLGGAASAGPCTACWGVGGAAWTSAAGVATQVVGVGIPMSSPVANENPSIRTEAPFLRTPQAARGDRVRLCPVEPLTSGRAGRSWPYCLTVAPRIDQS